MSVVHSGGNHFSRVQHCYCALMLIEILIISKLANPVVVLYCWYFSTYLASSFTASYNCWKCLIAELFIPVYMWWTFPFDWLYRKDDWNFNNLILIGPPGLGYRNTISDILPGCSNRFDSTTMVYWCSKPVDWNCNLQRCHWPIHIVHLSKFGAVFADDHTFREPYRSNSFYIHFVVLAQLWLGCFVYFLTPLLKS